MTRRLKINPDNSSYSIAPTVPTYITQKLAGGLPRQMVDFLAVAYDVNCVFRCDDEEYSYLMAFERVLRNNGEKFFLNLVVGQATLTDHLCLFLEDLKLTGQTGGLYEVSATISAQPITAYSNAADISLVDGF